MKLFEIILAIISIIIAIYNFDLHNFNRAVVSILIFLSAVLVLSHNQKLKAKVRKLAVLLAVFLLLKLLITG
jgi:hypothetical protein